MTARWRNTMQAFKEIPGIRRAAVLALLLTSGCIPEGRLLHRHTEVECLCQAPTLDTIQPEPGMEEAANQRDLNREEARRLAELEQDRQRLQTRVQDLEAALADKNRALAQAKQDIQAGVDEVARTRAELARWNQELAALRAKIKNAETENVNTLQSVISTLEKVVPRDRPAAKPDEPEELGMPRRQQSR
jgi:septal ring factor EnvC (AmiA/AmiB activator)